MGATTRSRHKPAGTRGPKHQFCSKEHAAEHKVLAKRASRQLDRMGRVNIVLNRPMTKKMTDALIQPMQRCIAAAWVAEERRLEHERENGKVRVGA